MESALVVVRRASVKIDSIEYVQKKKIVVGRRSTLILSRARPSSLPVRISLFCTIWKWRINLFIFSIVFSVIQLFSVRPCVTNELQTECPVTTICSQIRENSIEGQCKCSNAKLSFNPNFTSDDDYCIYVKSTTANDNASNMTNKTDTGSSNAASSGFSEPLPPDVSGDRSRTLPGTHHIIAGIFIPIGFVFIVIGAVFVYKKLHITHRVRNIRRTRRNRPFYEDVMLGNNENDDPPLI